METGSPQGHGPETTILMVCAALFHYLQMSEFDAVYNVLFKVLTIASLTLILIINWKKLKYILNPKNKKQTNENN